jgi:hypothetical protein
MPLNSGVIGLQMNVDELAQALRNISNEKLLDDLAQYIEAWKSDDRNVKELETMVERFFGNTWLQSEADHSKAYGLWKAFRDDAIQGIGGMTMNERLYLFGLFERFDLSNTEEQKNVVYRKLLAKP